MIKFKLSLLLIVVLGFSTIAQNKYAVMIKANANLYIKDNNFKQVIDYTYPELVALSGKDSLFTKLSNTMVTLNKDGLRYKSIHVKISEKLIALDSVLLCIVLLKSVQFNSQGTLETNSFLIAIANKEEGKWFFMDENHFRKHQEILLNGKLMDLEVPEKQERIFTKNQTFISFDKPK